jgi:SAM domain (Sterile alpha motif)
MRLMQRFYPHLAAEDLKELGVVLAEHRRRLLTAIASQIHRAC